MPRGQRSSPTTLQTVERAFRFLEFIAEAPQNPTVRDVARALRTNISTTYHMFNTLSQLGYVTREADQTLQLGPKVTLLYQAYRRAVSVDRDLLKLVEDLSAETGETASVSRVVGDHVVIHALAESQQPNRAGGLYVGMSGFEHLRASGRLILAMTDSATRSLILEQTLKSVPPAQRERILARLEAERNMIREQGWAIDLGDYQPDIAGVAAPIFNADHEIVGTVNVSTPASRFTACKDRIVAAAVVYARRASELLGSTH